MFWEIYDIISGDLTALGESFFGGFACEILAVIATLFVIMLPFVVIYWIIKMVWGSDYDY